MTDASTLCRYVINFLSSLLFQAIVKITKSISSLVTTVCGCDNESLPSSDPLQLLLVGCAYDERMVDPRVVDCFQEKVAIPLPTAQERRKLMRSAWSNVLREKQAAVGAVELKYPGRVLDALADAQAGVALVPLYHYCQRCVGSLLQQQRQNDTSQENEQGNVISEAFGRVAGLSAVKTKLLETVLWPRRHAAVYRSFAAAAVAVEAVGAAPLSTKAAVTGEEEAAGSAAVSFAAGILLFGPPGNPMLHQFNHILYLLVVICLCLNEYVGTGKTLLPRVLAEELGCSLVDVRISDVVRGEVGTSERRVAQLFQEAKSSAPCVVFIDEFQALFTARDDGTSSGGGSSSDSGTLTAALAGCFDDINTWNKHAGAGSLVTVIASTNEPWAVDPAFLRPGRLDMCVFVGPLDAAGREQLLLGNLRSQQLGCNTLSSSGDCSSSGNGDKCAADTAAAKLSPNKVSRHMAELCRRVAGVSEGFTGADLTLLLSRATELSFLRRRPAASLSPTAVLCSATTAAMDSVEEGGQCAAAAAVCSSEGLPPSNQVEDEVEVETELQWEDFETALQNTRASTTPGDVEEYLDWQRQYPYLL